MEGIFILRLRNTINKIRGQDSNKEKACLISGCSVDGMIFIAEIIDDHIGQITFII